MLVEPWLMRAAAAHPRRAAVETPGGSLTYAELAQRAGAAAGWLRACGARPGDRVGVALVAGLDFAVVLHACLLLGVVAVPLDLRAGEHERALVSSGCALVVDGAPGAGEPPAAAPWELEEPAIMLHTSGTTAEPRAITLTRANLLWSALGSAVALGLDAGERWLCPLPPSHVGGLSILVRSAIYATTAVVHERFDANAVAVALREQGVTLVSLVPTTLMRLLDEGLSAPVALRCALIGGGPVAPSLLARARAAGVPVSQSYGLTEAGSQVTTTPLAEIPRDPDGAGPPLFCTRVRIAADGEILVRGPTVASMALAADGWLHTGDLGRLDEGRRLHVTGRKADTIVSGGENLSPAEVEAVLESCPGVAEAAVVARPHPEWGEAVAAIVVPRDGAALDAETLRAHCAARLAGYKVPKSFAFTTAALPRTRSGKLLRRSLK